LICLGNTFENCVCVQVFMQSLGDVRDEQPVGGLGVM
jgi:hypothetical protein